MGMLKLSRDSSQVFELGLHLLRFHFFGYGMEHLICYALGIASKALTTILFVFCLRRIE